MMLQYYYIIILFAVLYYILSKRNPSVLLSILILIIVFYYYNTYRKENETQFKAESSKKEDKIRDEVKDVVELSTDNFYLHKNSKDIKYLVKNKEFMDILFNIRFIKRFDKTRYSNMIVNIDKLMKIYIYKNSKFIT